MTLFRPPNLLTVPGDIVAGYFLAGGVAAFAAVELAVVAFASLLFYAAGMLLNDWADAHIDAAERPERPIPSGAVSRKSVLGLVLILLTGAVAFCSLWGEAVFVAGAGLAAAIAAYNLFAKKISLVGPLNMGLCRGLNFLLGATLAAGYSLPDLAWWGFATLVGFIAAVTHIARREMIGRYGVVERWLPVVVLVGAFFVYLPLSKLVDWPAQVAVALLFLLATVGAARTATALPNRHGLASGLGSAPPVPPPALVGRLIGLLLILQSAFVVGSRDGTLPFGLALVLLALWPMKRLLGKKFYSS